MERCIVFAFAFISGQHTLIKILLLHSILHSLKINCKRWENSSGSSGRVRGGARNMKSMQLPSVAIFVMTYFHRAGGAMAPSPPLDPLLENQRNGIDFVKLKSKCRIVCEGVKGSFHYCGPTYILTR